MTWHATHDHLRIVVLAGGDSPEREISLASGDCVWQALKSAGHDADLIDPSEVALASVPWRRYDACFVALHGGAGEDGRIQQRLKLLKVPYTGSGPVASRLAMSKSAAKERFIQNGVATPPYCLFNVLDQPEQIAAKTAPLGFPLVLKPDSQGSSLGVGVAHAAGDLQRCLDQCRPFESYVIAEPLVVGREFTVALLGRQPLPTIEIIAPGTLFDYEAKYESAQTEFRFDPELPPEDLEQLCQNAVAAAQSLGTVGLVRVDLILDRDHVAWVLEVNTVPGLTLKSLAPRAAARAGLEMPRLCDRLVRECLSIGVC